MRLINTCLKSPVLDHGLFGPNTFNMVVICITYKSINFVCITSVCHNLFLLPAPSPVRPSSVMSCSPSAKSNAESYILIYLNRVSSHKYTQSLVAIFGGESYREICVLCDPSIKDPDVSAWHSEITSQSANMSD